MGKKGRGVSIGQHVVHSMTLKYGYNRYTQQVKHANPWMMQSVWRGIHGGLLAVKVTCLLFSSKSLHTRAVT